MEYAVYKIMKARHGDLFPMWVNGKPYKTKWLVRAEGMDEQNESREEIEKQLSETISVLVDHGAMLVDAYDEFCFLAHTSRREEIGMDWFKGIKIEYLEICPIDCIYLMKKEKTI